jgi:tetratricopeptide (TPR) repeat protein
MCILTGEFFGLEHRWQSWLLLTAPLFKREEWNALPFAVQAQLAVLRGWAGFKRTGYTLRKTIRQQIQFLRMWQAQPNPDVSTLAGHHLVLCFAYTLAFRFPQAREYGLQAQCLYAQTNSLYHQFRTLDMLGTLEYTAGQYDAALAWQDQAAALVHSKEQAEFLTVDYTRGWVKIGQGRYDEAIACFQRARILREYQGLSYDSARCLYAEAYACFRKQDDPTFARTRKLLRRANHIFFDDQPSKLADGTQTPLFAYPMRAACLHIDGLTLEYQRQYRSALTCFENAIGFQRKVNDPGQMSDMLRRAMYNALKCGRFDRFLVHQIAFIILRLRFRVPV